MSNQDVIRDVEAFMSQLRMLETTFRSIQRQLIRTTIRDWYNNPDQLRAAQEVERFLSKVDEDIRKLDKDSIKAFTLLGWRTEQNL